MGCRCRDMRNCKKDITKIEKVKELFSKSEVTNTLLSGDLSNLAGKSMLTFYAANMSSLTNEERKLNNDMTDMLPNLISKCENKIEDLHDEYEKMEREDHHYHKHHHHHYSDD